MTFDAMLIRIRPSWAQRAAALALLLAIGLASTGRAAAAKGGIAIVVPKSNTVAGLTSTELRKILLGEETQWPNREKITILLLPPGTTERKTVLQILLQMSDDDFVRHWISEVFQGQAATGPKTAATPASMVRLVSGLSSAIGVVAVDDLPVGDSGLRVLSIDGKTPGENGYVLAR
jgi:ABC-type phosphate transport system substrate-binding protein